ncbi:MAG: response regulator [Chitinispirillales bacterium]|jgi:signal transduction histidine kinase/CheY-like chemotaxis protein|nr:response regulator [Chitinispirillales bacterium]
MQHGGHLLARVIEYTPIAILILRKDGVVAFVNQYGQKLFGRPWGEITGKPVLNLFDPQNKITDNGPVYKSIIEGSLADHKIVLSRMGFSDRTCVMSAFKTGGAGAYQDSVTLVIRDITEELAAADKIEKNSLEIAKMESELIRSKAELKKLSGLKSNFLNIASHELNTPLTSIKGYSDIIIDNMKDKVDPSVFRMIESINRAADRLHKVVNNMLDVSKIEQKRLRLHPEMLDLGAIARDCIEEQFQLSDKRAINFRAFTADSLPQFYGDRARIQQMFTNLFNNAIKYSPDGSYVDVSIEVEQENRFHISVKDQGIGIDKNEYKYIFDPFYEVGNANRHYTDSTKFMGGGSGLGLSIVKGVVERHGGKIWIESKGVKKGSFPGSSFHILLPLRSAISWDDDDTRSPDTQRLQEAASIDFEALNAKQEQARPLILFIDPDKEGVEIASVILENVFDILAAQSGEQGLLMAFEHKPMLILMDVKLPGLDGYRICRILKSQEETRDIPIAFFSADAKNDEIQRCFLSGADDFIVKPFSGKELVEKVWRLMMKKREEETFK